MIMPSGEMQNVVIAQFAPTTVSRPVPEAKKMKPERPKDPYYADGVCISFRSTMTALIPTTFPWTPAAVEVPARMRLLNHLHRSTTTVTIDTGTTTPTVCVPQDRFPPSILLGNAPFPRSNTPDRDIQLTVEDVRKIFTNPDIKAGHTHTHNRKNQRATEFSRN